MLTVLAIDPGTKRVGLAISDDAARLAVPLDAVDVKESSSAIQQAVTSKDVDVVIVGLPISLDGIERASAKAARSFAESLRDQLDVPVELWDERLTTKEAEARLHGAGKKAKEQRGVVNSLAATVLLQSYLDSKR